MAKKRGNSEGTIHQLPSGSWRAQVSIQGHRVSHSSNTRREAQEWLRKTNRQIDDGLTYAYSKLTLEEYLTDWLKGKKSVVRRSTWVQYEQITRCYINPLIGHTKVTELRTEHIQDLYNHLLELEVGVHAVRKSHTILHSALQHAVKTSILFRNPATFAQPPRLPNSEMSILDESQVSQLLVASANHRLGSLLLLAIVTGARQMEILGLKWTDLDWLKKTIKIERQLDHSTGNGIRFSMTKTKYGRRSVVLGSNSIDILRYHFEQQHRERLAAGERWQETGLIFTTSLGTPINPRNLLRDYKKLLSDAGLPLIRFHDLRHTSASILLNNNIPPIVVSRRLGHSKPSITLDVYGHLIPSMQSEAAEKIDEVVTPVPVKLPDLYTDERLKQP